MPTNIIEVCVYIIPILLSNSKKLELDDLEALTLYMKGKEHEHAIILLKLITDWILTQKFYRFKSFIRKCNKTNLKPAENICTVAEMRTVGVLRWMKGQFILNMFH